VTRFAAGADHAGYALKDLLVAHLRRLGHDVEDLGTNSEERVDYPDFGAAVGRVVASGEAEFGILVCGSGVGVCIAANKVPGIRAATVHDMTSARLAREHNDANIICIGARFLGEQTATDAVDAFVGASFQGGRHTQRVNKLDDLLRPS
jgi:ribose 5-phosphate isomerase B